jgi:hypothetical protein
MSEHPYLKHFPKDHPSAAVQLAWKILDTVRPGVIPPIVRFELANQIIYWFGAIEVAKDLTDYDATITEPDLQQIREIAPDLFVRISNLSVLLSVTSSPPV